MGFGRLLKEREREREREGWVKSPLSSWARGSGVTGERGERMSFKVRERGRERDRERESGGVGERRG